MAKPFFEAEKLQLIESRNWKQSSKKSRHQMKENERREFVEG